MQMARSWKMFKTAPMICGKYARMGKICSEKILKTHETRAKYAQNFRTCVLWLNMQKKHAENMCTPHISPWCLIFGGGSIWSGNQGFNYGIKIWTAWHSITPYICQNLPLFHTFGAQRRLLDCTAKNNNNCIIRIIIARLQLAKNKSSQMARASETAK